MPPCRRRIGTACHYPPMPPYGACWRISRNYTPHPFAAADLTDRHDLCSSGAPIADATGGSNRREVKQLVLLAAELCPELASPAGAASGCVERFGIVDE